MESPHEEILARQLNGPRELVDLLCFGQAVENAIFEDFCSPHEMPVSLSFQVVVHLAGKLIDF